MNEQEVTQKIHTIEQRVLDTITNYFNPPVDLKNGMRLSVKNLKVDRQFQLFDLENELKLKDYEKSLIGNVKGVLVTTDTAGKVIDESNPRNIIFIPYLTNRGTYIINGKEKVITKQMRLKPGVYTYDKDNEIRTLMFIKEGQNVSLEFDPESFNMKVKLAGRDLNAITFFRILGITDQEIAGAINDPALSDPLLRKAQSKNVDSEISKIWGLLKDAIKYHGGSSTYPGRAQAQLDIQNYFFNISSFGETGNRVMNLTLHHAAMHPDKEVFLRALNKIMLIAKADTQEERDEISDDRDDIRFQDVLSDEDQIEYYVTEGLKRLTADMRRKLQATGTKKPSEVFNPNTAGDPLRSFLSTGQLSDLVEQTNPLLMSAAHRKLTSLGEGGLTTKSANQETRNLQNTAFGKLDPVETPESGKIGLVTHLTSNAKVRNLTIYSPYYKVEHGKFNKSDSNKVEMDPIEEYDKYIAFFDPNTIKLQGQVGTLPETTWARFQGKIASVPSSKVQFIDISPNAIWGDASATVPFSFNNDGNRMLMGSNMQKQAIILANREAPLVQNATDRDKKSTYEEKIAKEHAFLVNAQASGTVKSVTENTIVVNGDDGKLYTHKLMSYFPLNMSHYINNEPIVKPGDKVTKGDLLAEGWQTKGGVLAHGLNARIAYMPWKGYNFEDGYVVSEGFTKRMLTEELEEIDVEVRENQIGGPGNGHTGGVKNILSRLNVPKEELDKLDDDGIIKKGQKVGPGTVLVGIVEDKTDEKRTEYKILRSMGTDLVRDYVDKSSRITGYTTGQVIRVTVINQPNKENITGIIKIYILMKNPLKQGDKIAGRHGNKGIITLIEKDENMPKTPDGKPVEVIYSPLGVPSRSNLGQLYETYAGLIASKTGKPYKVYNFDKSEMTNIKKGLEDIGYPNGKMTLIDPQTGKPFDNPVTVGESYIMKLHHLVDEKLQARSFGKTNNVYDMPIKSIGKLAGEKENPQKLGEMELRALQASKAVKFVDEATKLKSDAAGNRQDRKDIFTSLIYKEPYANISGTPRSLKIFKDYSTALGLNVRPLMNGKDIQTMDEQFNSLMVSPLRDKEIKRLSRGEVTEPSPFSSFVNGIKANDNGLFDPAIFGEEADPDKRRTYWGHIDLALPMPNPLLLTSDSNPYTSLLGMKGNKIKSILKDKVGVIMEPGNTGLGKYEVVSIDEIEKMQKDGLNFRYEISGEALSEMLKEVNVDNELKNTQLLLANAKPKDRAVYYKKLRILNMLKKNDLKPEDLMIKTLPVLPAALRPYKMDEGNRQTFHDFNELYKKLIQTNNGAKKARKGNNWQVWEPTTKMAGVAGLYDKLETVMGVNTEPAKGFGGAEAKGILKFMTEKEGLIRGKLMSKHVDYSGRSVITVNPSLGLDEAGLPVDIAIKLYSPFVVRELWLSNKAKSQADAVRKAGNKNDPDTWEALQKVLAERPIILNRAPSLHKYSLQAFHPKLTKARAIELNPLAVTGFNADFDGDQMSAHVPLTNETLEEAEKLLLPSKTLINPTYGTLITSIKGEAILGLYYLTLAKKNSGKAKEYASYQALLNDYKASTLSPYDMITLNGTTATVGQHLVNDCLPKEYRDFSRVVTGNVLDRLIEEIIKDDDKNEKGGGTQAAVVSLNRLKDLGFLAGTKSGISIGIYDLTTDKNKDRLLAQADEEIIKDPSKMVEKYYDVQNALKDKVNDSLGAENPLAMFMTSKAKGNTNQATRMMNMVGLGRDITGRIIPISIKSSFKEGLSPMEMWVHAFDSRRGLADRSLSTAKPGELTRNLWNSTQDAIISIKDCGDTEGIFLPVTEKSILGRFLAQPVRDDQGHVVYRRGEFIDRMIKDKLGTMPGLTGVQVRSPLKCKVAKGVCQMCYGAMPGTTRLPEIGEPVGILASQAIGEPTAQGTMKQFHAGGVTSAKIQAASEIPRVIELFNISDHPKNRSLISPIDGKISSITHDVVNRIITVEGVDNGKKTIKHIKVPLVKTILVNPGDYVTKGQRLTELEGSINPHEILDYQGLDAAQNYLVNEVAGALSEKGIDRRHMELAVSKLTDKVNVEHGSTSPWLPGQVVLKNQADIWNTENTGQKQTIDITDTIKLIGARAGKTYKGPGGNIIVREGEQITENTIGQLMAQRLQKVDVRPIPIQYSPVIFGVKKNPLTGSENWFSQMGFQNIKEPFAEGAVFGKEDTLDEPRSRQMAGKQVNIGSGFQKWKDEFEKIKSRVGGTIAHLFG